MRRDTRWTPDFTDAAKYGRLQFVFPRNEAVYLATNDKVLQRLRALDAFEPTQDYLVWAGGDITCLIQAIAYLSKERNLPFIRQLRWERDSNREPGKPSGFYQPVTIDFVKRGTHGN